jgi:hypothetical protein
MKPKNLAAQPNWKHILHTHAVLPLQDESPTMQLGISMYKRM